MSTRNNVFKGDEREVNKVEEKERLPVDFEQSEYFAGREETILGVIEVIKKGLPECSIHSALAILDDAKRWLLESTGI